ncbi:hypothetical protein HPU229336_06280 [Helicobacter pullorum]|uniref:Uncharacterized protein n=1 Tax=Helicobacter pullorum TaxID=35818 RepID=A0AAW3J4C0_9HELI|nr:hypothetical protein [Helicobacter pullorum]KPH51482.1 hypothetical protein HPU229336_06280 [Helicobacter pullorum]
MNKPTNKPLTYNRFRAYLRIRLKNKSFSKTRVFLIIAFYILCSLTLFLLPHNVLTQYPYLKYFTDFMDFIPAIKQMEIKTYAPEMCKLYASYMFVVGVVCLVGLLREMFIYTTKGMLCPYSKRGIETLGGVGKIVKKPIKFGIVMISAYALILFCTYGFLNGRMIGYTRKGHSSTYFIDYPFEMLFYIDFWQGSIIFSQLFIIISLIMTIDTMFYRKLLYNKVKFKD